jgi:peptide/nickel transport system substrate-binding protein
VKDDHITLEANADYWAGAPLVQTVIFKPIPEPASRIAALEAGDVDLIGDVPIPSMERLQRNANLAIFTAEGMRNMKLTLDQLNEGPMKNVKVRQAMNYGVNVDEIISVIFKGQATKLNCQLLTPAYFGYNPNLKPYPFDPAKAKQLLTEAGYPDGLELEFKYPTGRYAQDKEVAEALSAQLNKAGFKIKQVVMESGKFLELENQRKLGPFFFVGSLTVPDAHYQLNQSITSANYTYFSDSKNDDLIDRANKTLDEKERLALYAQATQLVCENPSHVFLYSPKDVYAGKKSVTGFVARPDQWYDLLKVAVK